MLRRLAAFRPLRAVGNSVFAVPLGAIGFRSQDFNTSNGGNDRKNSNSGTSTHFDIQDVDADRLTHRYWDDVDSPYDVEIIELVEELGPDIYGSIYPEDRPLLSQEFLKV
ncbi:hypothetical protein DPX39_060020300 [Trypanosoma brucei equiperdum]|uniref:Uncharacterized protein n=1 Tax=Trypanosoma brucei equiperdum TaxID=630700 RepID=A0A3L6LD21_9TRYP|nr:hypothetical protein DPX39_060020300 [Trypanosoma brucei equiperdum]